MAQCIVTGCRLVIPSEGRSLWGDLHQLNGGALVFVGAVDMRNPNSTPWETGSWQDPDSKERQIFVHGDYIERRGVVAMHLSACKFNHTIDLYVQESRRVRGGQ